MSRAHLVKEIIVWLCLINLINCNQNVTEQDVNQLNSTGQDVQQISKRSDNVVLDGIQYLPECGLLCKLHKFTSHLPPVMINFNHQYQHYLPVEPILHHESEIQPEFHHPIIDHTDLQHEEIHPVIHEDIHPKIHPEIHEFNLHPHLPILSDFNHQHPLPHHLELSSNFHETAHQNQLSTNQAPLESIQTVNPEQQNVNPTINPTNQPTQQSETQSSVSSNSIPPTNAHQQYSNRLQTSATTLANYHDNRLHEVQQLFADYESRNPVTIIEENFPLPESYSSIETHPSSLRPLFIPDKHELKQPPYEIGDSHSNFMDYQPFHHQPPPSFDYQHFHSPHHQPHHHFDKQPDYYSKKPNIEM